MAERLTNPICFGERHRLFGVLLRGCAVPTDQVVYGRKAGSLSQNVRIGRPLSHLQHLARFRPGTIGIAKSEQAKVQDSRTNLPYITPTPGKRLPEVENGQRLLQVLIRRDQLAEKKKGSAAREVADQEHRRVFHILGGGQKLVGEFQSGVQLQLPPTHYPLSIKGTEGESRVADLRAQLARSRIHRLQFRRRPAFYCAKTLA